MSLTIPLSITLVSYINILSNDIKGIKRITKDVKSLSFETSVPGGYASCSISLDRPLLIQPSEIAYYGKLLIHDARHGGVIWEGYQEDPGRGADENGEIWELTAIGPAGHTQDASFPIIYVDKRLKDPWGNSSFTSLKNGTIENADEIVAAIKLLIPRGTVVTAGSKDILDITYQDIREASQTLARVSFKHISGITNVDWRVKMLTRLDGGASPGSVVNHQTLISEQTAAAQSGDTNFDLTHNVINLRLDRDNSNVTVPDDDTWTRFYLIVVRAKLKDVFGIDITNNEDFEDSTINFVFDQGSSNLPWARSTVDAQSGSWSMKSGSITHNQTSDMVVSIPPWADTVQFWYRVDSEAGFDLFQVIRDGTTLLTASGNVAWTQSAKLSVAGASFLIFRYLKDGSTSTGGDRVFIDNVTFYANYSANTVLASEVIKDLLGRALPLFDGPNAYIENSNHPITQLAYPDGVTPEEIKSDLLEIEPDMYWAVWERNPITNKHRYEFRNWPTEIRYVANIRGGFNAPGSADGLFNQAIVRWRSSNNFTKFVKVTSPVPELTAANRTRQALIDLGDELGASENATQVGQKYLEQHAVPPNAGSLIISGPILDKTFGRMVMPWEILPGYLIQVRGVLPNRNALNATTRDGVTVYRVVKVNFDSDNGTSELELDSPIRTVHQILADLVRNRQRSSRSKFSRRR